MQLRRRHWRITDAMGRVQEVRGPGVVGEQPVLAPGQSFEYTSGTPLATPSGIMVGTYEMETAERRMFRRRHSRLFARQPASTAAAELTIQGASPMASRSPRKRAPAKAAAPIAAPDPRTGRRSRAHAVALGRRRSRARRLARHAGAWSPAPSRNISPAITSDPGRAAAADLRGDQRLRRDGRAEGHPLREPLRASPGADHRPRAYRLSARTSASSASRSSRGLSTSLPSACRSRRR